MVADLEDSQKMDDIVQKRFAGNNAEDLILDILHPKNTFPADCGVIGGEVDTEGVSQTSFLTKLSLGPKLDSQNPRCSDVSRLGGASLKKMTTATTSPVTPLDLSGSPTQPLKKMKSDVLEQVKKVRLMLVAEDKRMLADAGCLQ